MAKGPFPGIFGFGQAQGAPGKAADLGPINKRLAADEQRLQELEKNALINAEVSGSNLVITHADGAKHAIGLPTAGSFNITADMIANALDRGQYNGGGSLKSLDDGWWLIPQSNTQVTGRPSGSVGDLIYFQQTTTPDAGNRFGVGMAFGKDKDLKDTMWVQYKASGRWTNWLQEDDSGSADLSRITAEMDELKRGNASLLTELGKIQTAAGNLFAPTKALFDQEANALIDAKLNPVKANVKANSDKLSSLDQQKADKSQITPHTTVEQVEQALTAKGWGPLSGSGPHGGGGDRPVLQLPKVWMLFSPNIPTSLAGATTTTTGEATLRKIGSSNERLWVIVEKDQAAKVSKIQVGTAPAGLWDTRQLIVDGQQYTGFYSAGGFTTFNKKVTVEFGG